jgi:hypothetical protein
MRLFRKKKQRQVRNPDEYRVVKVWNEYLRSQGFDPLPKFDHSNCGPRCPYCVK